MTNQVRDPRRDETDVLRSTTITTIELAKRVYEMREAQRTYFRIRTGEALDESKRLERELDKLVKEIIQDRPAMLAFGDDS